MKLRVLAVSTAGPRWADTACADYSKRLPPHWKTELRLLAPARRSGSAASEHWRRADSDIAAKACGDDPLILLDERGSRHTSLEFAARVAHWDEQYPRLTLLIGGPDGHTEELRAQAREVVRISDLTLPHALVRVVLLEQLYRASTINAGHPYHRE